MSVLNDAEEIVVAYCNYHKYAYTKLDEEDVNHPKQAGQQTRRLKFSITIPGRMACILQFYDEFVADNWVDHPMYGMVGDWGQYMGLNFNLWRWVKSTIEDWLKDKKTILKKKDGLGTFMGKNLPNGCSLSSTLFEINRRLEGFNPQTPNAVRSAYA
jgi:hypothetical protein